MNTAIEVAIIGIPGAWSSEILKESLENLSNETREIKSEIFAVGDIHYDVNTNKAYINGKDLESFSAIIIKKLGDYSPKILDWLDILSNIEDKGVPFFSSPKKLRNMISRIGCTRNLATHQIPIPPTLISENSSLALDWIQQREGAVFKPNFSTKARGMKVLKKGEATLEELDTLKNKYGLLYLQELVELPGEDYGIVFSGEDYIGTYARVGSKDSWNTTTQDGGHYQSYEPTEEVLAIAKKARAIFDLDFCCVDIAITNLGPIVFEVSAFGGFKGMYQGLGINSASLLSEYILNKINK